MKEQARAAVMQLAGVTDVDITMTAQVRAAVSPDASKAPIPGVKNVIAVGAGKGGVGKTTVAVNLALALAQHGEPRGHHRRRHLRAERPDHARPAGAARHRRREDRPAGEVRPAGGLDGLPHVGRCAGDLARADAARRHPQFFNDVRWNDLDYLVVDLPPGTGDVALSLSQTAYVAGAIVVTTPQQVSLADTRRAVAMYAEAEHPGARAHREHVVFRVPVVPPRERHLRARRRRAAGRGVGHRVPRRASRSPSRCGVGGDTGVPIMLADPESLAARAFVAAAERTAAQVSIQSFKTPVIPLKPVNCTTASIAVGYRSRGGRQGVNPATPTGDGRPRQPAHRLSEVLGLYPLVREDHLKTLQKCGLLHPPDVVGGERFVEFADVAVIRQVNARTAARRAVPIGAALLRGLAVGPARPRLPGGRAAGQGALASPAARRRRRGRISVGGPGRPVGRARAGRSRHGGAVLRPRVVARRRGAEKREEAAAAYRRALEIDPRAGARAHQPREHPLHRRPPDRGDGALRARDRPRARCVRGTLQPRQHPSRPGPLPRGRGALPATPSRSTRATPRRTSTWRSRSRRTGGQTRPSPTGGRTTPWPRTGSGPNWLGNSATDKCASSSSGLRGMAAAACGGSAGPCSGRSRGTRSRR